MRLIFVIAVAAAQQVYDELEIRNTINSLPVTCSSSIRLQNVANKYHLFSQSMNYGSGSGQQIVTCHKKADEIGGLWTLKEGDYSDSPSID
mgnify:FL=1